MTWILLAGIIYAVSLMLFCGSFMLSVYIVGKATIWEILAAIVLALLPGVNTVAALWVAGWCAYHVDVIIIRGRP